MSSATAFGCAQYASLLGIERRLTELAAISMYPSIADTMCCYKAQKHHRGTERQEDWLLPACH